MHVQRKPVEQVIAGIQALDLEPIKFKLMDRNEEGWSREQADKVEADYKRFLTLVAKYPEQTIALSRETDKFWHAHILDTMKYADDCQQVFGYFLHHFPYFGLRGAQDAAQLAQAGKDMERLYEQEFGESMPAGASAAYCMAASPAYCMASEPKVDAAYCMAAAPAYCMAAQPKVDSAYCMAARPDVRTRPALAQAA